MLNRLYDIYKLYDTYIYIYIYIYILYIYVDNRAFPTGFYIHEETQCTSYTPCAQMLELLQSQFL